MRNYAESREDHIPESLKLPDGRVIPTIDLLKKVKNYRSHRIGKLDRRMYETQLKVRESKVARHQAMIKMKIHQVMAEYRVNELQAWFKIKYSYRSLGMATPRKEDHQ